MCRRSLVLCCCVLLLVITSSHSRGNFNGEQSGDSTVRRVPRANSEKDQSERSKDYVRYNSGENSTMNHEVQRESHVNTTKDEHNDDDDDDDDSMGYDFRVHTVMNDEESNRTAESGSAKTSSTKVNDENNFASRPIYGNVTKIEGRDNHTVDGNNDTLTNETFKNDTYIQLCCPYDERVIQEKCVYGTGDYAFPDVYRYTSDGSLHVENKSLDEIFQLNISDPCQQSEKQHILMNPNEYVILANGTLHVRPYERFIPPKSYCLTGTVNRDVYDVITCKLPYPMFISIGLIVSLPFLLATFVVYTILPELQNMHGYTLRAHVVSLFISYAILPVFHQVALFKLGYPVCIFMAYVFTFSFLASFLWLNVICFDIWWAFRELRSTHGNIKQHERKKFALYSIYAWGGPLLIDIISAIMEYIPDLPEYLIRPNYCKGNAWIGTATAKSLYFYLPVGVTIIFNICFFVITAIKIIRHKKSTANDLRNTESKRHDDNKQRFMMYLKLLIVMGLTWIMEIASWLDSQNTPAIIWYPTDMINALQGVVIFLIFVCRKKIKRLLFKRLGWKKCGPLSKGSTSQDSQSSITTVSGTLSLRDISTRTDAK